MTRVGRPSKLTPDTKRRLLDAIRAGNYREPACVYAGISISTFYLWLEKGREQKSGQYMEFMEEVTRAEAEAEVRMVAQWQAHIPRDWRAARDFLARRNPKRWAPKERLDLSHTGEMTHSHSSNSVTEQLLTDTEFLSAIQAAASSRMSED